MTNQPAAPVSAMTAADIVSELRRCVPFLHNSSGGTTGDHIEMSRIAALLESLAEITRATPPPDRSAAEAMREACAKVLDNMVDKCVRHPYSPGSQEAAMKSESVATLLSGSRRIRKLPLPESTTRPSLESAASMIERTYTGPDVAGIARSVREMAGVAEPDPRDAGADALSGFRDLISRLPHADVARMRSYVSDKLRAIDSELSSRPEPPEPPDAENVTTRATVLAWKTAFDGIEAHILDRIAMKDSANPETYLAIIRADVARVMADSKAIEASWWHDRAARDAEIARLKTELTQARDFWRREYARATIVIAQAREALLPLVTTLRGHSRHLLDGVTLELPKRSITTAHEAIATIDAIAQPSSAQQPDPRDAEIAALKAELDEAQSARKRWLKNNLDWQIEKTGLLTGVALAREALSRLLGVTPIGFATTSRPGASDDRNTRLELARSNARQALATIDAIGAGKPTWECGTRKQGTSGGNEHADCNWPFCGCDPKAGDVLAAIQECDMRIVDASLLTRARSVMQTAADAIDALEDTAGYERRRSAAVREVVAAIDGARGGAES